MMVRLGRKLIEMLRELLAPGCKLLMDKAYCGAATRRLAEECGLEPVVPPKSNAKKPWSYDVVCPFQEAADMNGAPKTRSLRTGLSSTMEGAVVLRVPGGFEREGDVDGDPGGIQ